MPKSRTIKKKQQRKAGGMAVAELKPEDFVPLTPRQLGESLRKSVEPIKRGK